MNPHEKEWYEYDKNAVQYIPTADTVAPIRYWSEWDMGQRVVYKLDLTGASYYTQRAEIRQSLPNLVQVDWEILQLQKKNESKQILSILGLDLLRILQQHFPILMLMLAHMLLR